MAKRDAEKAYNTNLASEYLMMSLLNRAGIEAYLSLGNKKGVDILVMTNKGSHLKIEVKGVNLKTNDWLLNNKGKFVHNQNIFYALISFESEIEILTSKVKFWVIPSFELNEIYKLSNNGKTVYLSHKIIRNKFKKYLNKFDAIRNYIKNN